MCAGYIPKTPGHETNCRMGWTCPFLILPHNQLALVRRRTKKREILAEKRGHEEWSWLAVGKGQGNMRTRQRGCSDPCMGEKHVSGDDLLGSAGNVGRRGPVLGFAMDRFHLHMTWIIIARDRLFCIRDRK